MDEVEQLIEQLKSEDVYDRVNAANYLAEIKDERAIPALIEALKEGEDVLMSARRALIEIGKAAVPLLAEVLEDEDNEVEVRATIIDVIWKLGDASAIPALVGVLVGEDKTLRAYVPVALENMLGKCKTKEDLEKMEKGIEEGSAVLRKLRVDKGILIDAQMKLAWLACHIAQDKDALAPKRDLLLTDKPKPPKRGRGVYQTVRRATSR